MATLLETVEMSSIETVGYVNFAKCACCVSYRQTFNRFNLAKLEACEADICIHTTFGRVEIGSLIDEHLILHSVDKV